MKKGKLIILIIITLIIISGLIAIKPIKKNLATKKIKTGIALYEKEEYNEALPYFEKAVKLNDNFIEAYINLAKNLLALNENEKAFKIALKGLDLNPSAELYTICGQVKVKEEAYNESLEFLNKAIEIDTNFAVAYYYRGIAKANKGDLEASLADYKKAQDLDTGNPEFYKGSVIVRTKLDDYSGIIKDYNKIIELDPTNTEAFYQRGYFKLNLEDYESAIKDFNNAIKLAPNIGKTHYYKGLANAKAGNYEVAAEDFNKSAELGYKPHEALFNEGLALLQTNKKSEAEKAFESCIKKNPTGIKVVDAKLNLGVIQMMNNNFNKAVKLFTDILNAKDDDIMALLNRAYAYGSLKQYNLAIKDLTKCIDLGENTGEVYYARGVNYINIFEYNKGCEDLKIAEEKLYPQAIDLIDKYCNK